jgi:hypothetical protein
MIVSRGVSPGTCGWAGGLMLTGDRFFVFFSAYSFFGGIGFIG